MKIIILSSSRQDKGGVERFSYYLQTVYEKNGNEVSVFGREDLSRAEQFIVALVKRIALEQPVMGFFLGLRARKIGYDVVVTNGMLGWNLRKGTIINVQHGTFARAAIRIDKNKNYIKYLIKRYFWGGFEGLAARRATQCVAVSEETKESVEQLYHASHVRVIVNAVDTELFTPQPIPKKQQAIFVGRFEYAKGKTILEGMQRYLEQKGWVLVIAERLSQEALAQAYNESRVFLLPSLHEGCSYALLDAMACGLPFLASPVGLVPTLRDQGVFTAGIVENQSLDAYKHAFEQIITYDEEQQQAVARELRDYIITNHSLASFEQAYCDMIQVYD